MQKLTNISIQNTVKHIHNMIAHARAPTHTHSREGHGGGGGLSFKDKFEGRARTAVIKSSFKICTAEKLLLMKILFEEVRFKASFEGVEVRAVSESERERIPDLLILGCVGCVERVDRRSL